MIESFLSGAGVVVLVEIFGLKVEEEEQIPETEAMGERER